MAKEWKYLSKDEKNRAYISLLLILFFIILLFKYCGNKNETIKTENNKNVAPQISASDSAKMHTEREAYFYAQVYLKSILKSPTTAKFESYHDGLSIKLNDTTFNINGYVDSQNSFGAMIRAEYKCNVYYTSDNKSHFKLITFDNR